MASRTKETKKELTEEELKALQAQEEAEKAEKADKGADVPEENKSEAEKQEPTVVVDIDAQIEKRKTVGTNLQAIIRQRIREA